jgi:5-methylcytosine-specific restriction endonuclease McrA
MRTEFSKKTMREAYERSEGLCEGILASGERCCAEVTHKKHFDHVIPDALGGDTSLTNCAVLCLPCHGVKTQKIDVPMIAKAKRVADKHLGIRKPSRFPGSRDSRWKKKMNGEVVPRC